MNVSRMPTKLKISHVSLLHKKINRNTLNVGVARFHNNNNNNNNNVALVVVVVVVVLVVVVVVAAAVVPAAEASVAALVTATVAVLNRF